MWRCLKVSRSGCYAWLNRESSKTARRKKELGALIEWIFHDSHGTYGYRRVHAALTRRGIQVHSDTVRLFMGTLGLEAARPRATLLIFAPGRDSSTWPQSWTAAPRKQSGMRWPTICAHLWCVMPSIWRRAAAPTREEQRFSILIEAASTRRSSFLGTWKTMAFSPPRAGPEYAGTTPGQNPSTPY